MILTRCRSHQSIQETRRKAIIRQILECYSDPDLAGKFRLDCSRDLQNVNAIVLSHQVGREVFLKVSFPVRFPKQPLEIQMDGQFGQGAMDFIQPNQYMSLKYILSHVYKKLQGFAQQRQGKNIIKTENHATGIYIQEDSQSSSQNQQIQQRKILSLLTISPSTSNKSSSPKKKQSMTGLSDNELTQTKNLNRHFRSKLRQVYRDLMVSCPSLQDSEFIEQVFSPNRVGFEDIRKSLRNEWFNKGVKEQMRSGRFLHKILRGMMGVKSKKLMIKYYHVMLAAVQQPQGFVRWKYQ